MNSRHPDRSDHPQMEINSSSSSSLLIQLIIGLSYVGATNSIFKDLAVDGKVPIVAVTYEA